jgi:glycosyltransferase involved in cell wall biosynthesis
VRILYLTSYYKPAYVYGGPVRSVSALCEGLARLGAQVTVLTTNANGGKSLDVPLRQPVDVDGVRVLYYPLSTPLPERWFYSQSMARAFESMVADHDLAVLETFFTLQTDPAVNACLKAQVPYIIPPRGQLLPWALNQKSLKKRLFLELVGRRQLDRAAAIQCSDPLELEGLKLLKIKAPAFVIPNSLDVSVWAQTPPRGTFRRKFSIPDQHLVLLVLGRLHRVKNPELALEAFARLDRQDVHLVYAGPDEEGFQPRLQARAAVLGCAKQVYFTGLLAGRQVQEVLSDADLLLMPSVMESFGMAAVEAMAAGVPVVLSDQIPIGRWVAEAGVGFVAKTTTLDFMETIVKMISETKILRDMGERSKEFIHARFDNAVVSKQMLKQVRLILG